MDLKTEKRKLYRVIKAMVKCLFCIVLTLLVLVLEFGSFWIWIISDHALLTVDNVSPLVECSTRYSIEELKTFYDKWYDDDFLTMYDLRENFKVDRVRRTRQGFYTIIPSHGKERLYVFSDYEYVITDCLLLGEFPTRDEAFTRSRHLVESAERYYSYDTALPHVDCNTGAAYVAFYCTDGVEIVHYTQTYQDGRFYYDAEHTARNGCSNVELRYHPQFWLYDEDLFPFILGKDRQNEFAMGATIATIEYWGVLVHKGLITMLILALLSNVWIIGVYRRLKTNYRDKSTKQYCKKWALVFGCNALLSVLCYCFALLFGYPIVFFLPYLCFIMLLVVERHNRKCFEERTQGGS